MDAHRSVRNTLLAWALIGSSMIVARAEPPVDEPKPGSRFLTVADMLKTMEESKTVYRFAALKELKDVKPEEFANVYWPPGKAVNNPWIEIGKDKGRTLKSFPVDEETRALIDKGEKHFNKKKYDKAAKYYRQAIERSPRCYLAYLYLGDCHFHKGENARAVELYDQAIAINPHDFAGHFFKAHTLLRLGRSADARQSYIRSLTLRPGRESVVKSIHANADQLGVTLIHEPFSPQSLARLEGSEVALYSDPESLPWFAHAVCKAFWLGEPEHRMALNGTQEKRWSANEERECLAALLSGYIGAKEEGKIPPDPALERIHRILNDDLIDGFIYYEIMAHLFPDTVLLLPDEEQEKVQRYVERYVVPVNE